ncbi:MAG: DUF4270 domain-containing protein [Muribaculaceae bacterium]|nr:DUF4270 domain-containing protein [Muribaculaceae bacterium]
MKKLILTLASGVLLSIGFSACQSDSVSVSDPGSSLVTNKVEVLIDSSFTVTTSTIVSGPVQSRTTTQLLGAIHAKEFGTLRSDFVAQMFPSNSIETEDITPDSLKLQLVFEKTAFVGDSLAPIGIEVYPLVKQLPSPIYSNYDPTAERAYDAKKMLGSASFTAVGVSVNDTVAANPYRFAYVPMPDELMDGILAKYKSDPSLFNDPYAFQDFFPGVYVRHSFGSGRVTRISNCRMVFYYHKTYKVTNAQGEETDSISKLYNYFMAMAPELVSNSCIDYQIAPELTSMVNNGKTIVAAPAGYDVKLTFPIEAIINKIRSSEQGALSVINTLTFSMPAEVIKSDRGINPPEYLLLVLSNKKGEFFAKNQLPDNKTSFVGTYNANTKTYSFGDMREYLIEMLDKEEPLTADDYTFTLTPISMVTETSQSSYYYSGSTTSILSGITPMIAMPAMVELLPAKAKIKLTFSRQSF